MKICLHTKKVHMCVGCNNHVELITHVYLDTHIHYLIIYLFKDIHINNISLCFAGFRLARWWCLIKNSVNCKSSYFLQRKCWNLGDTDWYLKVVYVSIRFYLFTTLYKYVYRIRPHNERRHEVSKKWRQNGSKIQYT